MSEQDRTTPASGAPEADQAAGASAVPESRPVWLRPVLTDYGDVRELTMGGTSGTFESNANLPLFSP